MAFLTTILVALSPLIQPVDAAPKPVESLVSSPAPGPSPQESPKASGTASWYVPRPSACWDAGGRHSVPWWVTQYTAHPTLPCGTMVDVSGPVGSITIPVEDHGPEAWTGRALDLSPASFAAVAGTLATGVIPVQWGVAP